MNKAKAASGGGGGTDATAGHGMEYVPLVDSTAAAAAARCVSRASFAGSAAQGQFASLAMYNDCT